MEGHSSCRRLNTAIDRGSQLRRAHDCLSDWSMDEQILMKTRLELDLEMVLEEDASEDVEFSDHVPLVNLGEF